MQLQPNEIHVWVANLAISPLHEKEKFQLLSADERKRALRFHFQIHKTRFIAARSELRQILSTYLQIAPPDIAFDYAKHEKPQLLAPNPLHIQFNLSHSDEIAVYAFTLDQPIGIDIEKVQKTYNSDVSRRYFSQEENAALLKLPTEERTRAFYRIWSRKEALIKAIGKGLSLPLASFSVSANDEFETITVENETWSLAPLSIHQDFQSALASKQKIKKISFWRFFEHGIKLDKVTDL